MRCALTDLGIDAVLDVPTQHDLRGGLVVLGREPDDDRVSQRPVTLVATRHVDEDAADGRPGLREDDQIGMDSSQCGL